MEQVMNYVKPELVIVAIVLYFLGTFLKKAETVADKNIPLILGGIGILTCGIYVFATSDVTNAKEVAMAVFVSLTQGVLVAGLSVYANQIVKQQKQ